MNRIVIDTSAYSYFKRGNQEVVKVISSARSVFVPVIVLGELRAGFRLGSRHEINDRELAEFLSHPSVTILEVTDETSTLYSEIFADLKEAGTPIPTNDIWISAIAAREGATVVSCDSHFGMVSRIGSITIEVDRKT